MNSLRSRLTLLLAVAAALPLAVVLYGAVKIRRISDEEALGQARLLASLTAAGYEELFSAANQLVENYAASDELQADPPECPRSMHPMVRRYDYLLDLGVLLPDGRIACSMLPAPSGATFARLPFLQDALDSIGPVVSDFAVAPGSGRPVLFVGQAARDLDGAPRAVVFATLDLRKFLEIGRADRLPEGATLRVVDRHGVVLARHPNSRMFLGRVMTEGAHRVLLDEDSGAARFANLDGVERRNGFVAIHPGGSARIAISVGLDGASAVLPIEELLNAATMAALLALLGTVLLVYFGGKRLLLDDVAQLREAALAIGRGEFDARAGIPPSHGELADLDRSLGELGGALAAREAQLTALVDDLRAQRDQLRALYDALPVGIVSLTPDLKVSGWSAGAERLFGWSEAEVMDLSPPLLPPEDLVAVAARVREVARLGVGVSYAGERLTRDGRRLPMSISLAPSRDALGRVTSILSVFVDVSDLRGAEARVRRAEASLRAVIEAAPLAILAVDAERRATLWSGGAERLFGIPSSEVVGRVVPMPEHVPPEVHAAWQAFIGRALRGESFGGVETTYRLEGRDELVTDTSGAPVLDERGRVIGGVFAVLDITARTEGERRLAETLADARASRDHLRAIYDAVPVGVVTTLADGTVIEWSPGMERIFGWPRDAVIGERAPWVPPEGRAEFARRMEEVLRDEGIVSYDALRRRRDGSEVWVAIRVAPLRDAEGRPMGSVGVVMDISERRALEEREREAQARLQAIVAAVPVGIMAIDTERRVTLWSEYGERLLGVPAAAMVGRVVPEEVVDDPALVATWRAIHERVLAGEPVTGFEQEHGPNSPVLATSTSALPLRDGTGRVLGAVYAISDISERKRAERQVAEALDAARQGRDRLAALVSAAPVAIVYTDNEGLVRLWSPAAARIFGWTEAEALGRPLPLLHPDDASGRRALERQLEEGGVQRLDVVRHRKDGTPVWLSGGAAILRGATGEVDGLVAVVQDVTAERQAQARVASTVEELRRLSAYLNRVREEEQGRLAREVHDEFGQLLTGLKLDLTLLDRQLPDAPGNEAARQRIPQMRELVDELVSAGRRIVSELRPPALDRLGLGAALDSLVTETSRRGLTVSGSIEADTAGLDPDTATALYRIAQEGLTNVLKHSGATEARVRLARRDDRLRLTVEDNGRGLPTASSGGVGLVSMRERASLVGGSLRLSPRAEGGTCIVAEVPWRGTAA